MADQCKSRLLSLTGGSARYTVTGKMTNCNILPHTTTHCNIRQHSVTFLSLTGGSARALTTKSAFETFEIFRATAHKTFESIDF